MFVFWDVEQPSTCKAAVVAHSRNELAFRRYPYPLLEFPSLVLWIG
jgi:hypothetical protein